MALKSEFSGLWPGGYFEGDPRDPMGASSYGVTGYMSVLHATWLACIKPYVGPKTRVLEIGPGRGAWTKAISSCVPQHIYAVDVLPATETKFWEYVGRQDRIDYIVAEDCSLAVVPANGVDYFFSFGVFCHLHPDVTRAYVGALASRMTRGAHGFLMVADHEKYNRSRDNVKELSLERALSNGRYMKPALAAYRLAAALKPHRFNFQPMRAQESEPGGWHHLGADGASQMLKDAGFTIIDSDVGVNHRDPVIHFQR